MMKREYADEIDGNEIERITLAVDDGIELRLLTLGAIVESLWLPTADDSVNVVLGYGALARYRHNSTYFGSVAGRYANRIAGGSFELDGERYELDQNDGDGTLHGGSEGFNARVWTLDSVDETHVVFSLTSPDGDQGFPGTLAASVRYEIVAANRIEISYEATTDKPTVVNLTQHTYFNLAGEGSGTALDHMLQLNCRHFTPVDSSLTPTGVLQSVTGTAFDFTTPKPIGRDIRVGEDQLLMGLGYDHNFVLDRTEGAAADLILAAIATDPGSGRTVEVSTTEPGIQFYSGNFLNGSDVGPTGHAYRQSDGFALETQHFPNSPNEPSFPSVILRPGSTYRSKTVWEFGW